jgi:hypothetical protein
MHARVSHVVSCAQLDVQVFVDGQLVGVTDRDHTAKVKHYSSPALIRAALVYAALSFKTGAAHACWQRLCAKGH